MQNSGAMEKILNSLLRARRSTKGVRGGIGFKTVKQNFQNIHSTQFLHLPHKRKFVQNVQNDDTKALQSSRTFYLTKLGQSGEK